MRDAVVCKSVKQLLLAGFVVLVVASLNQACRSPQQTSPDSAKEAPARPLKWRVLDAVIKDVLTNPEVDHTRQFYGEDLSGPVGFQRDSFSAGYTPQVDGFQFQPYPNSFPRGQYDPRRLVVRLDFYGVAAKDEFFYWAGETAIEVVVFNGGGGGSEGTLPIGGCRIYYVVVQSDDSFAIEWRGVWD